jgi:uroporphyrinogen decarboxylase
LSKSQRAPAFFRCCIVALIRRRSHRKRIEPDPAKKSSNQGKYKMSSLSPSERIEAAVNLKTPGTATGATPVAPLIIAFAGRCAGITQAEIFRSVQRWQQAQLRTYERIGACDLVFSVWPGDLPTSEAMRCRLPGRELGDDDLFQIAEEEIMTRQDYEQIQRQGYTAWFRNYHLRLRSLKPGSALGRAKVTLQFVRMGLHIRSNVKFWQKRGIPSLFNTAAYPPFDFFSLARSLEPFVHDLFDCPESIQAASAASLPDMLATCKQTLKLTDGKRVCLYPMRSSASIISPKMFERFALPNLVQMVESFHRDGITTVLHCDGNWTPMLKFLKELPRASCIVELDGSTDIYKAKEILGDWLCLKGDVPATLLAMGEAEAVSEYCRRLIKDIGSGGGFILASGCEVPLNARVENVIALINAGRQF